MTEFLVLGPLEVRHRGTSLPRPTLRQRALLTRLLMQPGRVVELDALLQAVWGPEGAQPLDPRHALHTQISRLRTLLGPAAEGLATRPPGYLLDVDPQTVDARRFEELLNRAGSAASQAPARALEQIEEALSLWRGPAYVEFADSFARPEAVRLEQLHTAAGELHIELLLSQGRTDVAVAAAESLIATDPLREHPHGLLMRGLARQSRQGEALAVYRRLRDRLDEELGVEPSVELRELHQRVLRQELDGRRDPLPAAGFAAAASPDAGPPPPQSAAAVSGPAGAVPETAEETAAETAAGTAIGPADGTTAESAAKPAMQEVGAQAAPAPVRTVGEVEAVEQVGAAAAEAEVPLPLDRFVGRRGELASLTRMLGEARVLTLAGPGGVGKTRLAAEFVRGCVPDRRAVWVDLAAVHDPDLVVTAFLDAVGTAEPASGPALDTLLFVLRNRNLLLVVDNCEHVIDAAAATLAEIVRHCPDVQVVATSRERLAIVGEQVLQLAPLPEVGPGGTVEDSPAVTLFLERWRAAHSPGAGSEAEEQELAAVLCSRLDGLPLALELAAARAASLGLRQVATSADLLGLAGGRRTDSDRHRSLRAVLSWSVELLGPGEQRMLRRLAVFPGRFSADWVERVCTDEALPADEVPGLLASLVDKSLVQRTATANRAGAGHRLFAVVRQFAQERLDAAGEREAVRRSYACWLVERVEQTAAGLGADDEPSCLAELVALAADIRTVHAWALEEQETDLALRLSAALLRYATLRADHEILGWAEPLTALPGAREHPACPAVFAAAAVHATGQGALEVARQWATRALSLLPEEDDRGKVRALIALGDALLLAGRLAESDEEARRAWRMARARGDLLGEVEAALNVALTLGYAGRWEEADLWLARCREAGARTSAPSVRAWVWYGVGECLIDRDPVAAGAYLGRAYELASSVGATFPAGVALTSLVTTQVRHGGTRERIAAYRLALRHWQRTGNRAQTWITLRNLVPVLVAEGRAEEGLALHTAMANAASAPPVYGAEAAQLARSVAAAEAAVGPRAPVVRLEWESSGLDRAVDLATATVEALAPETPEVSKVPKVSDTVAGPASADAPENRQAPANPGN